MQQQGQGCEGFDLFGWLQGCIGLEFGEDVKVLDEFDVECVCQILEIICCKFGENVSFEFECQYLEWFLQLQ